MARCVHVWYIYFKEYKCSTQKILDNQYKDAHKSFVS